MSFARNAGDRSWINAVMDAGLRELSVLLITRKGGRVRRGSPHLPRREPLNPAVPVNYPKCGGVAMDEEASMSDIVERLRHDARGGMAYHELSDEAADEIERLQDAKRRALAVADERSKENVALRQENERLQERLNSEPTPEAILLQARPPDGGSWVDIFPAQLGWMAKAGFDVRALERPDEQKEDR